MSKQEYTAESIKALSGRDAVRLRPAMYFGSNAEFGLHAMLCEAIGFLACDFFEGNGSRVSVSLERDGFVTLASDWASVPVEVKTGDWKNRTYLELEMTQLSHCEARSRSRRFLGYGAGIPSVNFVSESFEIEIHRDGGIYEQKFERGIPISPVNRIGNSKERKTRIRFNPDGEIMTRTDFDFERLVGRLRELACFLPGFTFIAEDLRDGNEQREILNFSGGVSDYVSWFITGKETILPKPFFAKITDSETIFEAAFQFVAGGTSDTIFSLANGILTEQGGAHVSTFLSGLMTAQVLRKGSDGKRIKPETLRRGLVAAVSVRVPSHELHFEGRTRAKLAGRLSENIIVRLNDEIERFFEEIPGIAKRLRAHFLS